MNRPFPSAAQADTSLQRRDNALLRPMVVAEETGGMSQVHSEGADVAARAGDRPRPESPGSVINRVGLATVNEVLLTVDEARGLHIPLLRGQYAIHGFRTIRRVPSWHATCS